MNLTVLLIMAALVVAAAFAGAVYHKWFAKQASDAKIQAAKVVTQAADAVKAKVDSIT